MYDGTTERAGSIKRTVKKPMDFFMDFFMTPKYTQPKTRDRILAPGVAEPIALLHSRPHCSTDLNGAQQPGGDW